MSDHGLYALRDAFISARDGFYCRKKCSFIMAMGLFILLIVLLLFFLWCTPSFRIHFNRGMIHYAPHAGVVALYQPSTLYTWSKLLIGFFLWLTLAIGTLVSLKFMKYNKKLYVAYQHKVLMIESYIKLLEGEDGAGYAELKKHLLGSILNCIECSPFEMCGKPSQSCHPKKPPKI